ncbi:MAG TPA: hypothetical protein V6C99_00490 [Oculatellaceae cyanobacterium]|jgi:hypothetical protein
MVIAPTAVDYWAQPVDEEVSTSITQTWTDQAIKCYVTKADCRNCTIPKGGYSFICQMNKVVPVLLKTLGAPDPKRVKKLLPYLSQY